MLWRESINSVRFDSFHTLLAKMLHKVKIPPKNHGSPPETFVPPTGGTPILPPDFTPTINPQALNPPNIPEPSTGLIAVVMIAAIALGRHRAKSKP